MSLIVSLVSLAITIYIWLIIARAIMSFIQPDPYHPVVRFIYETTEPVLSFCRRLLPGTVYNMDFSPLIAIILLEIIRAVLVQLLYALF